ncbi:MAG TPA: hypothetical protein VHX88_11715 [Solirubrobacteraceae bacterium]|nr:hypothetical protein [Solirubrobacteraceae bacterium]
MPALAGAVGPAGVSEDGLARMCASVARTEAERSARMQFLPWVKLGPSYEDVLERRPRRGAGLLGLGRFLPLAVRAGARQAAVLELAHEGLGHIDFRAERCLYSAGEGYRLFAPGRNYTGRPGEWELEEYEPLTVDEPFWLLAVLARAARAEAVERGGVRGVECVRYRGSATFSEVGESVARTIVAWPTHAGPARELAVEAWLDEEGRIRRATCRAGRTRMLLELFDFGRAEPIALPAPEELRPASG